MLSLKTADGKTHVFKNGFDMWCFVAMNRPQWLLSEKLTDRTEINDIVRHAKREKAG